LCRAECEDKPPVPSALPPKFGGLLGEDLGGEVRIGRPREPHRSSRSALAQNTHVEEATRPPHSGGQRRRRGGLVTPSARPTPSHPASQKPRTQRQVCPPPERSEAQGGCGDRREAAGGAGGLSHLLHDPQHATPRAKNHATNAKFAPYFKRSAKWGAENVPSHHRHGAKARPRSRWFTMAGAFSGGAGAFSGGAKREKNESPRQVAKASKYGSLLTRCVKTG